MSMLDEMCVQYDVILLTKFGSHLYGTDTEASDTDYKGIYMPTKNQILLGKFPKSVNFDSNPGNTKNSGEDIDCELYSFHYFLELCAKGEMVAMDMLHANKENIVFQNYIWELISTRRQMFYTTDMKAFVGYAKKQAAKYGMKGSRITSAETMLQYLEQFDQEDRMFEHWHDMPVDENMYHKEQKDGGVSLKFMEFMFCGKTMQSTAKVGYILEMVGNFLNQYGHRAKKAAKDEGVDWKAVSHACRAADQMMEIYQTGDLQFPLEGANFLRDVKLGKFKFEYVLDVMEATLSKVDELSAVSTFPAKVDRDEVDVLVASTVANHLGVSYE